MARAGDPFSILDRRAEPLDERAHGGGDVLARRQEHEELALGGVAGQLVIAQALFRSGSDETVADEHGAHAAAGKAVGGDVLAHFQADLDARSNAGFLEEAHRALVQHFAGGDYRLYAVSNAGSLLGLLAYPFLFEPHVGLTAQWIGFAVGIGIYAVLLLAFSHVAKPGNAFGEPVRASAAQPSRTGSPIVWMLLPAASCFLLNSLTTHVTLDVMPMPLIWTASLGIFLLSYIVGFSGKAERLVAPCAVLSAAPCRSRPRMQN